QFSGDDIDFPVDCAVVFGAAVHKGSVPGPGITRRVETAVDLYNKGKVKTIFLTGGKGSEELESEAAVMQKVAMRMGVDPADIVLEDQARSTWENLQLTAPLVADCTSIVGISDRYHLARIAFLADMQGWGNFRTLPAKRVPNPLFETRAAFREALGIVYYSLHGLLTLF
ncbi:hypothetical protein COV83_02505, partial [Candidatus Peregrinibacteria bacterium CG11_big_fil_rev_8_21_14_0_20_49_14]